MSKLGDVLKQYDQQNTLQHYGVKGMKWDEKFKKGTNDLLEKVGIKETEADKAAKKEGFKNAKDKAEFDALVKQKKLNPKQAAEFKAFMVGMRKNKTNDFGKFAKEVSKMDLNPKITSKMDDKKTRDKVIAAATASLKEAGKKPDAKSKGGNTDTPKKKLKDVSEKEIGNFLKNELSGQDWSRSAERRKKEMAQKEASKGKKQTSVPLPQHRGPQLRDNTANNPVYQKIGKTVDSVAKDLGLKKKTPSEKAADAVDNLLKNVGAKPKTPGDKVSDALKSVGLKKKTTADKPTDSVDSFLKDIGVKKKSPVDKAGDLLESVGLKKKSKTEEAVSFIQDLADELKKKNKK